MAATATDDAAVVRNRRRVDNAPAQMVTAIGPPPSNHVAEAARVV
jgi:hypothetical protein